jgi:hypothetical protein
MKSAAISAAFSFVTVLGRILFTSLKDVFKRAAVLGRATVSEQFNGHCGRYDTTSGLRLTGLIFLKTNVEYIALGRVTAPQKALQNAALI